MIKIKAIDLLSLIPTRPLGELHIVILESD